MIDTRIILVFVFLGFVILIELLIMLAEIKSLL